MRSTSRSLTQRANKCKMPNSKNSNEARRARQAALQATKDRSGPPIPCPVASPVPLGNGLDAVFCGSTPGDQKGTKRVPKKNLGEEQVNSTKSASKPFPRVPGHVPFPRQDPRFPEAPEPFNLKTQPSLDTPEVFGGLKTWPFESPKYLGSLWV